MLPNNKKNAVQVSHVYGIANTGNNVLSDQMPASGPTTIAKITNAMPKISLINAIVISKNPPKDKQANNRLQLCLLPKRGSLGL